MVTAGATGETRKGKENSRESRELGCVRLKLARAQWDGRGAPDPSEPQGASDFDPTSHADFGAATHTHLPLRVAAPPSIVVKCERGGSSCGRLWCCSSRVFVCVTCFSFAYGEDIHVGRGAT